MHVTNLLMATKKSERIDESCIQKVERKGSKQVGRREIELQKTEGRAEWVVMEERDF